VQFIKKSGSALSLDEKQHFRIVTARATSQPLFLRMLVGHPFHNDSP
jgi:hypothetical protein